MYLIVGLGNPGRKYMFTRHNVGFEVIDLLASKHNIIIGSRIFDGLTGKGKIGDQETILLKPLTYMNLSGISVLQAMEHYQLDTSRLIVVYDDVDLELGKIRIRKGGSAGTHNGMKSVVYHLQMDNFPRIRLGIGRPEYGEDLANHVLDSFSEDERVVIDKTKDRAVQAVETIFWEGIDKAMSVFNG